MRMPKLANKNPEHWAKMVSKKVSPATLQAEVAQVILWDLLEDDPLPEFTAKVFRAFAFITGDPAGWGKPIDCIHSDSEIRDALIAIGYQDAETRISNRAWQTKRANGTRDRSLRNDSLDVDKAWRAFWHRRGRKAMTPTWKCLIHYESFQMWWTPIPPDGMKSTIHHD